MFVLIAESKSGEKIVWGGNYGWVSPGVYKPRKIGDMVETFDNMAMATRAVRRMKLRGQIIPSVLESVRPRRFMQVVAMDGTAMESAWTEERLPDMTPEDAVDWMSEAMVESLMSAFVASLRGGAVVVHDQRSVDGLRDRGLIDFDIRLGERANFRLTDLGRDVAEYLVDQRTNHAVEG